MAVKGGIKFLRKRVRAVQNLKKVTKAMKSVSSVRLRKSQPVLYSSVDFIKDMNEVMNISQDALDSHEYEKSFSLNSTGSKLYIILGSDKGLCGSFNSNIIKFVQSKNLDGEIWVVGKKLVGFFSKRFNIQSYDDFWRDFSYEKFENVIYKKIEEKIFSGEISEVFCIYNLFKSVGSQVPFMEKVFPVYVHLVWGVKHIVEPNFEEFSKYFIMSYVKAKLFSCFQSSITSEHAARMRAMDMATQNADRVRKQLILQMNKARQEAITKELIDIVSGKNAIEAQQI